MAVPPRLVWAAAQLDLEPAARLLEVGCSSGALAALLAARLDGGTVRAIDRSPAMIAAARRAHAGVAFEAVALADAALPPRSFDAVVAFNVAAFWKDRAAIDAVMPALAPGGRLYVFHQPPTPAQVAAITDAIVARVIECGRVVEDVRTRPLRPAAATCVIAR